jgi:hypothetical protein
MSNETHDRLFPVCHVPNEPGDEQLGTCSMGVWGEPSNFEEAVELAIRSAAESNAEVFFLA